MIKYIQSVVKQQIIQAPSGTVTLLSAPTGSGKTTFFMNGYSNHLRLNGQRMLLVENRVPLRTQMLNTLTKKFQVTDIEEKLIEKGFIAFDDITVITYQYLAKVLADPEDRPPDPPATDATMQVDSWPMPFSTKGFDVVVFDECHFFLEDALFNPLIDPFKNIPRVFSGTTRIYTSATLWPVRDIILNIEHIEDLLETPEGRLSYPNFRFALAQNEYTRKMMPFQRIQRSCMELTGAKEDYSYLVPAVMKGFDDKALAEDIRARVADGTLQKALVFVSSKKMGRSIQKMLKDANISCSFLFTETDDYRLTDSDREEEQNLIREETFHSQVLLATARLENGVNIIDSNLTHIYPDGFEEIALKQQIGRYRRKDDRKITVVFRVPDEENINRRLNWLKNELDTLERYKNASDQVRLMMLMESDFTRDTVIKHSFQRRDGLRKVSDFSCQAMSYYIQELHRSLETLQKGSRNSLLLRWLNWFGLQYDPAKDGCVIAADRAITELKSLLDKRKGIDMDKDDCATFRKEFKAKHLAAYPEIPINRGQNKRIPGVTTVNKLLKKFHCEIVTVGKGIHRLQDKEERTDAVSSGVEAV